MTDQLQITPPSELSVVTLVINLLLGSVFAFILAWHYKRYGKTLTNRSDLARIFPLIVLTTVLVISIVKASLALSLGLVGALSIVRFRTPIKEPEELAYLFLAIGIGLGFGADQRIATLVAAIVIMGILILRGVLSKQPEEYNLYLNVEVSQTDGKTNMFNKINDVLTQHVELADMKRLEVRDGVVQAMYYIDCNDSNKLTELMDNLKEDLPGISMSFVDQKGIIRS